MPPSLDDASDAHLRRFPRPAVPPPDQIDDVYLIGICGTGMGALAGLFDQAGYSVRGADDDVYPPMSTHLAERGIPVEQGYDPAHLDPPPDLTVVGNACTPTHPEAAYARDERLVQQSFPEALGHCFLSDERRPLVITGTHGKTTTTGLLVHLLRTAGIDPGYLIGGIMKNTGRSYDLGSDAPFVVEGDEYDSAYFDKRPKFSHYQPHHAVVTSVGFDHGDIFADEDEYRRAFESFVGQVEPDGTVVLCGDDRYARALAEHTNACVETYGFDEANDIVATNLSPTEDGQSCTVSMHGVELDLELSLYGRHNVKNALAAAALAHREGLAPNQIAEGLSTFAGMKRRQEVLGRPNGILVLDDFAHHPTAVKATLEGLRAAHSDRRIVAIFEPRSNTSRRKRFESDYGMAFDAADRVFLKAPPVRHNDDADAMLDPEFVTRTIEHRGTPATSFDETADLLPVLTDTLEPGDLAIIMSNGSFDGLPEKLPNLLEQASR